MSKQYSKKKCEGATFTPDLLASFLSEHILRYIKADEVTKPLQINDPACGDGALLKAIAQSLKNRNISFCISGSDTNQSSLRNSNDILKALFPDITVELEQKDFIAERFGNLFSPSVENDIIIANPPYVRTQILGSDYAQYISKLYNLSGRVDLYYPFLINMTDSLRAGGILGVITSNRYLTTKSGASVREFLYRNYDILEIIDLGDTKLFDAAVLPAIFIGRKKTSQRINSKAKYTSIYESFNLINPINAEDKSSIYDVLSIEESGVYRADGKTYEVNVGTLETNRNGSAVWQLKSEINDKFIGTIESNSRFHVSDFFKVRVGVKSCADDVFLAQEYYPVKPENEWFRHLISQENIQQWIISDNLQEVVYPHYGRDGKKEVLDIEKYPKAKRFFDSHKERLEKRTYLLKSNRRWYEYWVPQNAILWDFPKVVWADISSEPRFAFDNSHAIVNGNCYWICATSKDQEDILYLIMGVANSQLLKAYHDSKFNNKLYNGKRRYLSQYVEQYPLPDPDSTFSQRIISIVKTLITNKAEDNSDLVMELERNVRLSFGFKD